VPSPLEGRILRFINSGGASDFDAFFKSAPAAQAIGSGRIVRTRILDAEDLTHQAFEAACAEHFAFVCVHDIENSHRRLYLLRKLHSGS